MNAPPKKTYIYQEILERLFTCRYRFGDRILVKEISEETGVSRQPIMTALNTLQDRGFVRITAQVGCEVVTPSPEGVRDFYRMFAAIEGLVAELATSRATPAEVAKLQFINNQIAGLPPGQPASAEAYRLHNVEFHKQLHSMARSPIVCGRQRANFELSDFFIVQTCGFNAHLEDVTAEHQRIIECIVAMDPLSAHAAAKAHIESVSDKVASGLRAR